MKLYKQEGRFALYQMLFPISVGTHAMGKYLGATYEYFYCKPGDPGIALLSEEGMQKISVAFYAKAADGIPREWVRHWEELDRKITQGARAIHLSDLAKLSPSDLKELYLPLYQNGIEMWTLGIFIDALDTGFDQEKIEEIAREYSLTQDEVQILLTPEKSAYISLWEDALYTYKNNSASLPKLMENFFWIRADYRDFAEVDESFVQSQIEHAHKSAPKYSAEGIGSILEARHLDRNPLRVFQELAEWRDDRKRMHFVMLYGCARILREILRRQGVDPELFKNLTHEEAGQLFDGKDFREELQRRVGLFLLSSTGPDGITTFSEGEEAEKRFKQLKEQFTVSAVSEFKGMVASRGKVIGRVRLVPTMESETAKLLEEGDILVTSMTRPEFLPIMKKAGAIVTNEGGISCHAAIVSRELGKPCIIGTKIATRVFKDGDLVEVDAEKGIVRKI